MNGLFITATGTEIGKTLVSAALTYQLRQSGTPVNALKPIISGIDENDMDGTDTAILASAMGLAGDCATLNEISPLRYKAPLAPAMAAKLEGKTLDYASLLKICREGMRQRSFTIIEGVGGAFVPLTHNKLVADWIADLGLPSLLVAGSYLGTLSHIIATLEAMKARGLTVKGIVVSESAGEAPDFKATLSQVRHWTGLPVTGVPRISGAEPWQRVPDLTALADR